MWIGNPFEESLSGHSVCRWHLQIWSPASSRTSGAITVAIEKRRKYAVPRLHIPCGTNYLTAGEWNRAAAANNRVELMLNPAPASERAGPRPRSAPKTRPGR